ncbi:hypothetical protein AN401_07030 [Zobellella denitrificans]|uniref:GemA protein n=1 Tax=Zobellella denitrificans TaxID=347534 RepID=A0A291HN85_9GAMM|nr:regulatory protein GemA [Zobellella denitrificans]ATG73640.1 hypothetical protein AN401_07030 [Zobellella denitrificans]
MNTPAKGRTEKDQRTRELAAIHAARRDLALDDESYRDLLWSITGQRSAADLNARQRRAVLDQMRRLGAKQRPRKRVAQHPGRPHNLDSVAQLQKIEAQLADMRLPWSYADAIARQQCGIERVAWLKEPQHLQAVIAALHVEQKKRGMLAQLREILARDGITEQQLTEKFKLKEGWQRRRVTLNRLINLLM